MHADHNAGTIIAGLATQLDSHLHHHALQDSYLWAGPLAYMIKTVLTSFVVVAVLRPFRAQHRRALFAESQRATGLRSSVKHMLLDKWDRIFGRRFTTREVVAYARRFSIAPWWLER